jgi:PAS domain S-box-containing protein
MFERSSAGVARMGLDGRWLEVNDRFCEIFGYAREELLRLTTRHITHSEDLQDELLERDELTSGKLKDNSSEKRFLRKDGSNVWIARTLSLVRDASGAPQYFIVVAIDITEYLLIRQKLQESQDLLLFAQSTGGICIWGWDPMTNRAIWGPDNYRLFGRAEEKGPPSREEILNLAHPSDRGKISKIFDLVENGGSDSFEVEYRTVPIMGKVRRIYTKGRVHRDAGGRPIRILGADVDVSARREAEESARRVEKLAALERLATSIAHEISNPLLAVWNMLYLIGKSSELETAQQYSRLAKEELRRVTHYATHVLRWRRAPALPQPHMTSAIVAKVADLYEHRNPNVELVRDFRDTIPLISLKDDLDQLFSNLIGNAFDAVARGGRILVRVAQRTNFRSGEAGVQVLVADTGKGMSSEVKSHLFEPFFSTKEKTGIGLGLWISSDIVQRHDGRIRIRSSHGKTRRGTVVSVFLPFRSPLSTARPHAV